MEQTGKFGATKGQASGRSKKGVKQGGIRWCAQYLVHYLTLGFVHPPKTERSEDYRQDFLKANPGLFSWTKKTKEGRKKKQGVYLCAYCGKVIYADAPGPEKYKNKKRCRKMYVDHVKPLNHGGINSTINLVPACFSCNSLKSDKGGLWVLRGVIGKVIYTALQSTFNLITGIFTNNKDIFSRASKYAYMGVAAYFVYLNLL